MIIELNGSPSVLEIILLKLEISLLRERERSPKVTERIKKEVTKKTERIKNYFIFRQNRSEEIGKSKDSWIDVG